MKIPQAGCEIANNFVPSNAKAFMVKSTALHIIGQWFVEKTVSIFFCIPVIIFTAHGCFCTYALMRERLLSQIVFLHQGQWKQLSISSRPARCNQIKIGRLFSLNQISNTASRRYVWKPELCSLRIILCTSMGTLIAILLNSRIPPVRAADHYKDISGYDHSFLLLLSAESIPRSSRTLLCNHPYLPIQKNPMLKTPALIYWTWILDLLWMCLPKSRTSANRFFSQSKLCFRASPKHPAHPFSIHHPITRIWELNWLYQCIVVNKHFILSLSWNGAFINHLDCQYILLRCPSVVPTDAPLFPGFAETESCIQWDPWVSQRLHFSRLPDEFFGSAVFQ